MAPESVSKKDAYAKRNANSIPDPIELDPDPDFNPGVYVPPESKKKTKKRGRKRKAADRSDEDEEYEARPRRSLVHTALARENLLAKYFGDATCSSSDEDDLEEDADDEIEDEDAEDSEVEEDEPPLPPSRTWLGLKPTPPAQPDPKPPEASAALADNDDTESESDYEPLQQPSSQGAAKPVQDDDDATESESDYEIGVGMVQASKPPAQDSDTESDSSSATEDESFYVDDRVPTLYDKSEKPKPSFALQPDQKLAGALVLDDEKKVMVPGTINTYLREYQRDGVRFFWKMYSDERGGLLGDDMGLGKTVQVISFLSAIMQKKGLVSDKHRRHKHVEKLQDGEMWRRERKLPPADETWPTALIVAPLSVLPNWEREIDTWGYFEVGTYSGTERKAALKDFEMGRLDVLLTTNNLVRSDVDLLYDQPFSCIFVDEAHCLKNPAASLTKALQRFVCQRRLALTGTAIQNSYSELHTILDWTNPGTLGTKKQWRRYVSQPLTIGQSTTSTEEQRAKAAAVALILRDDFLPNFFLRRTKDIIKDQLPVKTDNVVFCPLTDDQRRVYKRILEQPEVQNLIYKDEPCPCGSKKLRKKCCFKYEPADMLRYMAVLLKLSNHLGLILPGPNDSKEQLIRARQMANIAFPDGNAPSWGQSILEDGYCGKWTVLNQLLKSWKKEKQNNKVLLFTKSVKLLEMLDYQLRALTYRFVRLDGNTKDRMALIDQFNMDPDVFVFLISTMAGGTGLNLTAANKVVIFDPNWNPAHDLQAMDRAFRFGQTRNVNVYRLLGAGSLEELIYARQLYKQQQMAIGYEASAQTRYFKGIQNDNNNPGELFGLKNIFKFQEGELATKMAIEKANLAEFDWAMANMSSRGKASVRDAADIQKAEKSANEDGVRGLGAFLFDDGPVSEQSSEQDDITKILSNVGIQYTHRNDDVLRPSLREQAERLKIEMMRSHKRRKSRKSESSKSDKVQRGSPNKHAPKRRANARKESVPKPIWPPIRNTRKPKVDPEELLSARYEALLAVGYIKSPDELTNVAQQFASSSAEEQQKILKILDDRMAELRREQ